MSRATFLTTWTVTMAAIALTFGCGDSRPGTHPVSGVVTYEGEPVEGATVAFSPTEPDTRAATGVTDAEGRYRLTTFEKDDGALPGPFKVRVFKYDREPEEVEIDESEITDEIDVPEDYDPDEGADIPAPQHVLPEQYNSHSMTPLSFTVEEGENTYNIDLE